MYISSNDFGYYPRYKTKNMTMGFIDEKDLAKGISLDYNPSTGKFTPKIEVDRLKDAVVDKVKEKIKQELQNQVVQELASNIINPAWIGPGTQFIVAIKFTINATKTLKQILDAAVAIYGQKVIDHFSTIFYGGFGQYRDEDINFNEAASKFFGWSHYSNDTKEVVGGYIEEAKKFRAKKLHVWSSVRMLQNFPYYEGVKSKTSVINQLYPENTKIESKTRETMAMQLGMFVSNLIEPAILGYLIAAKGQPLDDGNIPINISEEFQAELDKVSSIKDEDFKFPFAANFITSIDAEIPKEISSDDFYISKDQKTVQLKTKDKFPEFLLPFTSKLNIDSDITGVGVRKNPTSGQYEVIFESKNIVVDGGLKTTYPSSVPNDTYFIYNKLIGTRIKKDSRGRYTNVVEKYYFPDWQKTDEEWAKYANDQRLSMAMTALQNKAIDLKAVEPDTFEMAKSMDETTARIFLKAVEDNPYPFKGLSHKFYFDRINKIIEPEIAKVRKNRQRITLGVVAALGVGYALLSE